MDDLAADYARDGAVLVRGLWANWVEVLRETHRHFDGRHYFVDGRQTVGFRCPLDRENCFPVLRGASA